MHDSATEEQREMVSVAWNWEKSRGKQLLKQFESTAADGGRYRVPVLCYWAIPLSPAAQWWSILHSEVVPKGAAILLLADQTANFDSVLQAIYSGIKNSETYKGRKTDN